MRSAGYLPIALLGLLNWCGISDCVSQSQFSKLSYTNEASNFSHLLDPPREKLNDQQLLELVDIVPSETTAYTTWYGPGPAPTIGDLAARRLSGLTLSEEIREKMVSQMTVPETGRRQFRRFADAVGVRDLSALQAAQIYTFCEGAGKEYDEIVLDVISSLPGCIDGKFDPLIDRCIESEDTVQLVLAASAILKRCNKVSCWNNRIIAACAKPLPGWLAVSPDTRRPFDQRQILLRALAHNGYPTTQLKEFVSTPQAGADFEHSMLVHAINWQVFRDDQSLDYIVQVLVHDTASQAAKETAAIIVSRDILLPNRVAADLVNVLSSRIGIVASRVATGIVRNFAPDDFDDNQLQQMLGHRDARVAKRIIDWHSEWLRANAVINEGLGKSSKSAESE